MEIEKALNQILQQHNEINGSCSILQIPNEIYDAQKQFLEIKKFDDFYKKL